LLDGAVELVKLVDDVAEDGGAAEEMLFLVRGMIWRARNRRMPAPGANRESSGRISAEIVDIDF
jgi:hypothetical protein